MEDADAILRAAEEILHCLHAHQLDAVVIGAVALAAHRYVRQTEDLDLGVNANVRKLRELTDSLRQAGYQAELHEPDADDPLGGVIDIEGSFGLIQIISYADKFPAVIEDALREARLTARPGSALKLIPLPHLIALKLYAGGTKSRADAQSRTRRGRRARTLLQLPSAGIGRTHQRGPCGWLRFDRRVARPPGGSQPYVASPASPLQNLSITVATVSLRTAASITECFPAPRGLLTSLRGA